MTTTLTPVTATRSSSLPASTGPLPGAMPRDVSPRWSRGALAGALSAAVVAVAAVGGGAYWLGRSAGEGAPPAMQQPVADAAPTATPSTVPGTLQAPLHAPKRVDSSARGVSGQPSAVRADAGGVEAGGPATQAPAVAAVCHACGVVESVQEIQHKGEGSGLGAVAGGVLGGALGSQVGRGGGRTAMTVLGAIGGGLAGNEVEKRAKATTAYRVTVRTDDGALHSFEQSQPWTVGQRVRVDGRQLHAATP